MIDLHLIWVNTSCALNKTKYISLFFNKMIQNLIKSGKLTSIDRKRGKKLRDHMEAKKYIQNDKKS